MKILYICNSIIGAGGLERVLSIKASKLADAVGYEVHILSLNESKQETFFAFSSRIVIHTLTVGGNPLKYISQYYTGIRNKVTEIQPDIISVCDDGLKGFFIPKILRNKIPVIYERHASVLLNASPTQHFIMKHLAAGFDKLVVLTPSNLKEWKPGNTAVIPNPVSFYPERSATLSSKKVIAVGSHSYNKGYDRLLVVWQKIEAHFGNWSLDIYGKFKDETYLSLAKSLKLKNVYFHQPYANIEEKYLEASVFVLPSRSEGFGMVIIEAMACGLPVVSFDCPHGPADIITHGKDGLLIENGDTDNFAEQLSTLMRNEQLRKQFGAAAKVTAQRYKPDKIVEEWDDLFRSLLNQYQ